MKSGLGIEAGMDLLEVGCGTGQLTELLASWVRPGRVTGVDFSPCMLERARAKCPNADFKLLDICNEPPALAQFDVVLCFQSFPHFRDKTAALGNIARALKPGGRLIILHFASSAQIGALHASMGDAVACDMLPPPPMWPKWLGAAGLQLESYTDREGLFLLVARRPCCGKGGSASGTESCSDPKLHNPHLKGFTLVELLVVISILGILAGLGFPGFAKAREKAKVTKVHAELYG
ncbi:MAG: methyltransferase domain-containing protein, partial [Verrucomicrobiae bacterium]|nr:methyltransferase domain-containing protein [Verrucomicrobiae bacterium]